MLFGQTRSARRSPTSGRRWVSDGDEGHVRVIVRETHRAAGMGSRPSFPTAAVEIRPYTKDTMFRTDLEDDEDLDTDEVEPDADADTPAEAGLDEAPLADDTDQDEDQ